MKDRGWGFGHRAVGLVRTGADTAPIQIIPAINSIVSFNPYGCRPNLPGGTVTRVSMENG